MIRRKHLSILAMFLTAIILGGCAPEPMGTLPAGNALSQSDERLRVSFINIGKGDALLIETPEHGFYLSDTGKAGDFPQIARLLRVKGVTSLDGIFLSHGHKDHAGGLEALMKEFPTRTLYLSASDTVSYRDIDAVETAGKIGVPVVKLKGGEQLSLGSALLDIWLPGQVDLRNGNNNSVVMRLSWGHTAFLFTGDMEKGEEAEFLLSGMKKPADVLKLGHHGETDATSAALLKQVQPKFGLICGNMEENPDSCTPEMAARLKSFKVAAFYSQGPQLAVDFVSDGSEVWPETVMDRDLPGLSGVKFKEVNRRGQYAVIKNSGEEPADLTGCVLISRRGNESYFFPEGQLLPPGGTVTVACRDSACKTGCLVWDIESAWSVKKEDLALLYDSSFNLLDEIN